MAHCAQDLETSLSAVDVGGCLAESTSVVHTHGIGAAGGIALVVAWVVVGVAGAIVLGRRGHDLRSVVGLAVVLGPLFLPLAMAYVRNRDPYTRPIELVPTPDAPGRRAVVVVLGSPEAAADALPVLDAIEGIRTVTLVTVIDYESAQRREWDDHKREAERRLRRSAILLADHEPGLVLIPGTVERGIKDMAVTPEDVILIVGDDETPGAERLSGLVGAPVVSVPASNRD